MSDGALHVMPTLTGAEYGEDFLYSGCLDLHTEDPAHPCNIWWGQVIYPPLQCDNIPPAPPEYVQDRNCGECAGADILKPVQLARLHTRDIFSFRCRVSVHVSTLHVSRFGRVEWRARLPLADWIRPALWLMPERDTYGGK